MTGESTSKVEFSRLMSSLTLSFFNSLVMWKKLAGLLSPRVRLVERGVAELAVLTVLWTSPTLLLAIVALFTHSSRKMLSRSRMLWMIPLVCLLSCVTGEWLHAVRFFFFFSWRLRR